MDYTCITMHNDDLNTIIDAAIPNKSQNQAVKVQVNRACDQLMNRIADGWLELKLPEASNSEAQSQLPGPPSPKGTVLCGDDGRIVGVSDGTKVLRVEETVAA
jgi:hypothetical protein